MKVRAALLAGSALLFSSARADWVVLTDGRRVQGIDYKKRSGGYLFTVETGKTVYIPAFLIVSYQTSPPGERVTFRGQEVTLREKILTLKKERKAYLNRIKRAVTRWARGGKSADEARREVLSQPVGDQELCFGRILAQHPSWAVRKLAADQLGHYELVSGGTAWMLTEVADPVVRFCQTGVVLDVRIARSEQRVHLATLERITGQRFGTDAEKWRAWWEDHKKKANEKNPQ